MKHDGDDDDAEVLLDQGQVPEEVAARRGRPRPTGRRRSGCSRGTGVAHRADAGHEGGEGADDGDEAGDDDRLAAVLLVERVRLLQVLGVEEARFRVVEDLGAQPRPDRVVDGVPQDGRRAQKEEERPQAEDAEAGEAARGEEERVAGRSGVTTSPVSRKTIRKSRA
jgi:hypothetical protein